jgi:hypothetical protein
MDPMDGKSDNRDAPDGSSLDAHLLELRARLRSAREERGGCPPWDELKADHVPGGAGRPGREERAAHAELCPYCNEHIKEWRQSFNYDSDRLEAVERGVARGIAQGAKGLLRTLGRAIPGRSSEGAGPKPPRSPKAPKPSKSGPPRALSAREEREQLAREAQAQAQAQAQVQEKASAPVPGAPAQAMYIARDSRQEVAREPAAAPGPLARVLVVEMIDGRNPPPAIFLCAQVLDAEVATVDSIDELKGDPDLALVCGVILGGSRPPASWPDAVRHARAIVPRRPVVLLATFGSETTPGARRALGDALRSEADPAELILLSLDPDLR